MSAGKITLQAGNGKLLNLSAPSSLNADKSIIPANINGDNTQTFKVADAVNADEAVSKGQLLTEMKAVDGAGSGLDADLLRGLPADFTASKAGNGYQKLPSGLIIQWGVGHSQHDNGYTNTFPITFPNACFSVTANHVGGAGNTNVTCNNATTSNFISYTEYGTTTNITIYYIAIGY